MPDIFLSYNREDQITARRFAEAFGAAGFDVWWDTTLRAGEAYDQVTEQALADAKAVVVLWSPRSVNSRWVRAEATQADRQGTLVPVMIEPCKRPIMFELTQTAELGHWTGDPADPAWIAFLTDVRRFVEGKAASPPPTTPTASPPSAKAAAPEPLLAVLAFDNLSGDPEMAYFSDGVSQEILDTVAQGADVKVIARGSSFQLRGADKTARNVAATLHATHVLDGAVRRAGNRVRISAQLVHCATETSLWTNRFDRQLEDIFALQDEIAAAVAEALRLEFSPRAAPAPVEPDVYDSFLKAQAWVNDGRFLIASGSADALALLDSVVSRSPTFAPAWELLALMRAVGLRFGWLKGSFQAGRVAAIEAAERALALDPSRGRAYSALTELEPAGAFEARIALIDKGLAIAPQDPGLLVDAARNYACVGRSREGVRFSRQARIFDPLLPMAQFWYASERAAAGHLDEALAIFEALQSAGPMAAGVLQWVAGLGRWDLFDRWRDRLGAAAAEDPALARTLAHAERLRYRDPAAIGAFIDECRARIAETGTLFLDDLLWLSGYGQMEVAFELAEAASFEHMFRADGPPPSGGNAVAVIFIPSAESGMMRDPRFVRLCAKLGLVHYWLSTGVWPDFVDWVPYDFRAEARAAADAGLAAHV